MNYLAHLYLSSHDHELIVGNFIADGVKGKQYQAYPAGIAKGIMMHRNIDTFTDSHPITKRSKEKLRPQFDKFSGVITDMFYDHFLAKNWNQYSSESLESFTEKAYIVLKDHHQYLPERFQIMLIPMAAQNWLLSYETIEGIGRSLSGMARRISAKSNLEHATNVLEKDYVLFEKDFEEFFPELISFGKRWS